MNGTAAPFLEVRGVKKTFGNCVALDGVSLRLHAGEFMSVLGPSGCGKTTLLRVVAGLETQDAGQVLLNNEDISTLPTARRGCGIVFQSYALFPNMSALRNVAYGLKGSRQARRERAKEMLSLVGLDNAIHRFPAQLSGGQQQRVALARALAPNPALLLLDEPLSALDARVRGHLRREIREIQSRLAVPTLMVTHDQEEALTMADRVVVMNEGRIMQDAGPTAVYHTPGDAFVADFMGAMNFLGEWNCAGNGEVSNARQTLRVDAGLRLRDGQVVTIGIRPEDVQLAPEAHGGQNVLQSTVEAVEFRGPVYRLHLALPPGENGAPVRLDADVQPRAVEAHGLEARSAVLIHLPPERIHLFDARRRRIPCA